MWKYLFITALVSTLISCNKGIDYDGSGNFEADEVIVSAQQTGMLISLPVAEGDPLAAGAVAGQIDVKVPELQKQQAEASIAALRNKTSNAHVQLEVVKKQLLVQQARMEQLLREKNRTSNLLKADAATPKQLDDITAEVDRLEREMNVTREQMKLYQYNIETQNRSILSEQSPLEVATRQYQEQINKGQVINPVQGVVLSKYALQGELATVGKPLYKIANIDTLSLKAYVTGDKLAAIKLGQQVTVRIDQGKTGYKNYNGIITWIAAKSEFTPKTIQTKNERANLVYAVKVRVKNDGFLKIGMYGEMLLK